MALGDQIQYTKSEKNHLLACHTKAISNEEIIFEEKVRQYFI